MRFSSLLFLFFLSFVNNAQAETYPIKVFVMPMPGQVYQPFIAAIDQAKRNIHMTMFRLTNDTVADALIRAQRRGVAVRIILDRGGLARDNARAVYRRLTISGVQVKPSTTAFSITHAKTMTVDNRFALITSLNLNGFHAFTRDYGAIIQEGGVVDEINAVFDADWKNADSGGMFTPQLRRSELVWSPTNSLSKLRSLVESSKKTIIGTVETISEPSFVEALEKSVRRGVEVRLILPMCSSEDRPGFNFPAIRVLQRAGAKVRMMRSPASAQYPFMHGKMLIVDSQQAYLGSINFSVNSLRYARELGIIFSNIEGIQKLNQTFEVDWNKSLSPPTNPMYGCQLRLGGAASP